MDGLPPKFNQEIAILNEENAKAEEALRAIEQALAPPVPMSVERTLGVYESQWTETARVCIQRAAELEAAAANLRKRAEDLLSARNFLDDVKQAVIFEIESRNRAASLALVNPTDGG